MKRIRDAVAKHIKRIRDAAEYRWRVIRNRPMTHFKWVTDEGEKVGDPIPVLHLTLHDMMEHKARWYLTMLILKEQREVNAVEVESFERIDEWNGLTWIQPRFIPSDATVLPTPSV